MRFTPGELHDVRIDAGILQPRPGFGGVTDQFAARHHLGHDEPRAETPGKHAKGQIRHAGHRRERYAIADFDIPIRSEGEKAVEGKCISFRHMKILHYF